MPFTSVPEFTQPTFMWKKFKNKICDRLAVLQAISFFQSVGVLVSGAVLAQAIMVLVLPITTRIYTPNDFSILAVFTGLVSIISVAACLRFDVAVSLPKRDEEAANLLGLALCSSMAVAAVLAIFAATIPDAIVALFDQPGLKSFLWLLPAAVILTSAYSSFQMWFLRRKAFASITRARVYQSCAGSGTQVGIGLLGWTPFGLILGQTLNSGAGCIGLGYQLIREESKTLRAISLSGMRTVFSSYNRFPRYSTVEALCNSAAIYLPVIMIATMASGPEAGYLNLAMFAMQAPMSLIGTAVSQVYLSHAPDEHRSQNLGPFTIHIIGGLVKSGVGPLVFVGIVAPTVFPILFGDDWRRAGVLVAWMTPWFIMQFLASTVSMALHVTGNQRSAMILQLFGLLLRVGAVYGAFLVLPNFISEAYALSGFVLYLVYFVVVMNIVNGWGGELHRALRDGMRVILMWSAGGGGLVLGINGLLFLL